MADAQAARDDMVAAQADTMLFPRRFVACMAFLMRVGTVIDDEAKGQKFRTWWKTIAGTPAHKAGPSQAARPRVPGDPLFEFMRDIRNAELKRGESTRTAQHQVHLAGQLGLAGRPTAAVRRSGSRAVGPEHVVVQGVHRQPPTRAGSQILNASTTWLFARGGYVGQDVVPLIDQYLTQLVTVLQQAETLTD